jgi:Glycosyltransferase like family
MISVIICSRTPHLPQSLTDNICQSAGVPCEIICVDNSKNEYSIFSAYNVGASKAKYELLCFMHADVIIHTTNWGIIVSRLLQKEKTGVIGVAGSKVKSEIPSPWWISNFEFYKPAMCYNLIQHSEAGKASTISQGAASQMNEPCSVLVIDGVWMCCNKKVWSENKFDEQTYSGFHFYDLDFSMKLWQQGFTNLVCFDILIEHLSAGSLNRQWIEDAFLFQKKWEHLLPASTELITPQQQQHIKKLAIRNLLSTFITTHTKKTGQWLRYWLKGWMLTPFAKTYYSLAYHYMKMLIR